MNLLSSLNWTSQYRENLRERLWKPYTGGNGFIGGQIERPGELSRGTRPLPVALTLLVLYYPASLWLSALYTRHHKADSTPMGSTPLCTGINNSWCKQEPSTEAAVFLRVSMGFLLFIIMIYKSCCIWGAGCSMPSWRYRLCESISLIRLYWGLGTLWAITSWNSIIIFFQMLW